MHSIPLLGLYNQIVRCWYLHRCCCQEGFTQASSCADKTATNESCFWCVCVYNIWIYTHENTWCVFVLSPQECRIAHPIVKCTYCRSEFQQERWDMCDWNKNGFQILFALKYWISLYFLSFALDVNPCLFFTVKPIQSARNVPRMSNSLEQWVSPEALLTLIAFVASTRTCCIFV